MDKTAKTLAAMAVVPEPVVVVMVAVMVVSLPAVRLPAKQDQMAGTTVHRPKAQVAQHQLALITHIILA